MGNRKFTRTKFLRGMTVHPYDKESRRKSRALGSVKGKVMKFDPVRMGEESLRT